MNINKKITFFIISTTIVVSLSTMAFSNSEADNSVINNKQISATFVKTYHIWDRTLGYGGIALKNGGYLLTGDLISGIGVYYPFIIKTDSKGNVVWSKRSGSPSNVYSVSSSRHIGKNAIETTDGGIVMVSDTSDFISVSYEKVRESYGDILVTKLNSNGVKLWSIMFGDYATDQPQKLWALPDGGVMILSRFTQTGFGNNVSDYSALPKFSVLTKVDKNGQVKISKKMEWDATDMERLANGSFIALANVNIPISEESQIVGATTALGPLPTIIKLNSALNVEWAKSIEAIALEMKVPTGLVNDTWTTAVTKMRSSGGDFKEIELSSDGGFVAFGYTNLFAGPGGQQLMQSAILHPFTAVKVDATGKYLWARKLTSSLFGGSTAIDFQVTKTSDNGFVISQEVVHDNNWQSYQGNSAAVEQAVATNIELIKTDSNFNAKWIKKISVEKDLTGYDIQPTQDGGVAVTGIATTTKTHIVMGNAEPYKEAILIKADVNGKVLGCASVSDHPTATVEDQSPYLIMQNMTIGNTKDLALHVNKKVAEKISTVENTARDICEYLKSDAVPVSTYLNTNVGTAPVTTPVAKTWVQINFESAKDVPAGTGKNLQIHSELLPILNKVFNNQVKLADSAAGMWLTYNFARLPTRADVEAVQKEFVALGYKVDESDEGTLNVSKVGLSIRMTFSFYNIMKGEVDVMF